MFKKLGKWGIAAGFLVAFGLGMFVQDVVLARWSCVYSKVQVQTLVIEQDPYSGGPSRLIGIGEQVLCAKDWRITSIYGPRLPAEYTYEKWAPKLEWIPFHSFFEYRDGVDG